jgi:hypothetical protein
MFLRLQMSRRNSLSVEMMVDDMPASWPEAPESAKPGNTVFPG